MAARQKAPSTPEAYRDELAGVARLMLKGLIATASGVEDRFGLHAVSVRRLVELQSMVLSVIDSAEVQPVGRASPAEVIPFPSRRR